MLSRGSKAAPCSGPFALGRPHYASTPRQDAGPEGLEGGGGGLGVSGVCLLDKMMILRGIETTVGYMNRPQNGGMWRFPMYASVLVLI